MSDDKGQYQSDNERPNNSKGGPECRYCGRDMHRTKCNLQCIFDFMWQAGVHDRGCRWGRSCHKIHTDSPIGQLADFENPEQAGRIIGKVVGYDRLAKLLDIRVVMKTKEDRETGVYYAYTGKARIFRIRFDQDHYEFVVYRIDPRNDADGESTEDRYAIV